MFIENNNQKETIVVPTNDYVFKRIFGHVGNEGITIDLLNSILSDNVKTINLDENPILEKDLKDDKLGILDIKATLNNEIYTDIEMQVAEKADMVKRILFYWAKLYSKGINAGDGYKELNKTICILIANYELEEIKELTEYHTEWKIIENKYRKTVLTPVFEIHIISLPKLNLAKGKLDEKERKLLKWCQFLVNPYNVDVEGYDKIMEAKGEIEKLRNDKRERWLAEQRQKYIWDMKATEKFGYEKGKKEGKEEGVAEGAINKSKEIAKKMLDKGKSIEEIIEYTGLTEEEIEEIK